MVHCIYRLFMSNRENPPFNRWIWSIFIYLIPPAFILCVCFFFFKSLLLFPHPFLLLYSNNEHHFLLPDLQLYRQSSTTSQAHQSLSQNQVSSCSRAAIRPPADQLVVQVLLPVRLSSCLLGAPSCLGTAQTVGRRTLAQEPEFFFNSCIQVLIFLGDLYSSHPLGTGILDSIACF